MKIFTLQPIPGQRRLAPMTHSFLPSPQLTQLNQLNQLAGFNPLQNNQQYYPTHGSLGPIGVNLPVINEHSSAINRPNFAPAANFVFAEVRNLELDQVPRKKRSCHDLFFAFAFIAFIGFLVSWEHLRSATLNSSKNASSNFLRETKGLLSGGHDKRRKK